MKIHKSRINTAVDRHRNIEIERERGRGNSAFAVYMINCTSNCMWQINHIYLLSTLLSAALVDLFMLFFILLLLFLFSIVVAVVLALVVVSVVVGVNSRVGIDGAHAKFCLRLMMASR